MRKPKGGRGLGQLRVTEGRVRVRMVEDTGGEVRREGVRTIEDTGGEGEGLDVARHAAGQEQGEVRARRRT